LISNNHEFLSQFCPSRFASQSEVAGAKFRGGYSSGFTLTELLIVIIIIGIVATLALPMLVKTIEKAKLGEATSNLNLIRTGEKIYFLEYGFFSGADGADKTAGINALNIENPNTTSAYFTYTIETAKGSTTDFTARAQRKNTAPSPYSTYYYEIKKDGTITTNGTLQP
jgi:type IV pilus assembly protein PilE